MTQERRIWLLSAGLGLLLICGCSSDAPTPTGDGKAAEGKPKEEAGIAEVDVTALDLPALAEPVGPLGEANVMIAGPKGWFRASRSDDYLVRYNLEDGRYPSIKVTETEADPEREIDNLHEDNLDEYAQKVKDRLDKEVSEGVTHLGENVRKLKFKNHVGISYITKARKGGVRFEVNTLEIFRDRRKYTLELLCGEATAREYEHEFWAVANALEFKPEPTPLPQ